MRMFCLYSVSLLQQHQPEISAAYNAKQHWLFYYCYWVIWWFLIILMHSCCQCLELSIHWKSCQGKSLSYHSLVVSWMRLIDFLCSFLLLLLRCQYGLPVHDWIVLYVFLFSLYDCGCWRGPKSGRNVHNDHTLLIEWMHWILFVRAFKILTTANVIIIILYILDEKY